MKNPPRVALMLGLGWPYKRHQEIFAGTQRYAGFRFVDNVGATHYGWILLSVSAGSIDFVSAAYQATANTAILAGAVPEPGTMAALALGAVSVLGAVVRRRRQA